MKNRSRNNLPPFSSNVERLSVRECFGLLLLLTVLGVAAGPIWARFDPFEATANYRIPYDASEDYWLFRRYCKETRDNDRSFVVGDSFIWGQYVEMEGTLTAFLNQHAGSERFVNLGLDGTHPLALEGLIKHHCKSLKNRRVILHLNLLWVSSPQADLRLDRVPQFNHPRLVPQFTPAIPGYHAFFSDRLGVVAARYFPALDWSRHIQTSYYQNTDLPHWTLDHPYENPFRELTRSGPSKRSLPHPNAQAWFMDGTRTQAPPWVKLEDSLQWGAFQRLVGTLQARGNDLSILVGPLNEHMLEARSTDVYRGVLQQVEEWLHEQGLPYYLAPVLPSDLYADLSHPLADGYAMLAQELWRHLSG